MIHKTDYYTPKEAALKLKVTVRVVRYLITKGVLRTRQHTRFGRIQIEPESVEVAAKFR